MLSVRNLRLTQGDFALTADWSLPPRARVAVIGPSGGGKSTLLAAIAGFLPPTSGRILWDGADLAGTDPGARPCTILFQDQNLFPHLTLRQNIGLGLRPDLKLSPDEWARVEAALDRVGLGGLGGRATASLSGGQAARAALARALLRARPLLLLDEPFAALGPALRAEMRDLVAQVADETGATVLMVSHEPADARAFAALTIMVAEGRANPPLATTTLFAHPPQSLRDYLGQ